MQSSFTAGPLTNAFPVDPDWRQSLVFASSMRSPLGIRCIISLGLNQPYPARVFKEWQHVWLFRDAAARGMHARSSSSSMPSPAPPGCSSSRSSPSAASTAWLHTLVAIVLLLLSSEVPTTGSSSVRGGRGSSGGGDHNPLLLHRSDFVFAAPTYLGRLPYIAASRTWRRGIRGVWGLNPADEQALTPAARHHLASHGDVVVTYPGAAGAGQVEGGGGTD